MAYSIHDLIGNIGVVLIVVSYLFLQLGRLRADNIWYSLANLFGAVFIIISLWLDFNLSAFAIEAFWVAISLIGVVRFLQRRGKAENL